MGPTKTFEMMNDKEVDHDPINYKLDFVMKS